MWEMAENNGECYRIKMAITRTEAVASWDFLAREKLGTLRERVKIGFKKGVHG